MLNAFIPEATTRIIAGAAASANSRPNTALTPNGAAANRTTTGATISPQGRLHAAVEEAPSLLLRRIRRNLRRHDDSKSSRYHRCATGPRNGHSIQAKLTGGSSAATIN